MSKKDPFMIDPDEAKELKKGLKNTSAGVICPKMNKQIGGHCAVCESIQPLWQFPKGHPKRDLASQKKAKVNFYMNVVFPDNPEKSYILEVGKNAGNAIIAGIEKKGWTDIVHPKSGMGRELTITKSSGDGYNQYSVSPVLQKAEYDIPKSVLDNLPNLDNIIEMIKNGELSEDSFKKVSDLRMDETMTFRMCPPAKDAEYFKFIAYVWRHWGGVTQAEVDGDETVNLSLPDSDESDEKVSDEPWNESDTTEKEESSTPEPEPERKHEPCFGKPEFFDAKDEDCQTCDDFKECKKACKSAL